MRFHIKNDGTVEECKASKGECPFGGEENHYTANFSNKYKEKVKIMNEMNTLAQEIREGVDAIKNHSTFKPYLGFKAKIASSTSFGDEYKHYTKEEATEAFQERMEMEDLNRSNVVNDFAKHQRQEEVVNDYKIHYKKIGRNYDSIQVEEMKKDDNNYYHYEITVFTNTGNFSFMEFRKDETVK
jgi:hypothetical protein